MNRMWKFIKIRLLKGKVLWKKGCVIGPSCYLEHSTVSLDSVLQGHNILVNAILPEHHILDFGSHIIEEIRYE